jgi:hypothetical protein
MPLLLAQSGTRSAAGGLPVPGSGGASPRSLPVPGEWTADVGSGRTACRVAREAHAPGAYACGTL